jgi:hypothetical protein
MCAPAAWLPHQRARLIAWQVRGQPFSRGFFAFLGEHRPSAGRFRALRLTEAGVYSACSSLMPNQSFNNNN